MPDLTPTQRDAVHCDASRILIRAGAGTGKTRTLTRRVARLVRDGVTPERVVLVTFTNRAASEMVGRLAADLGPVARRLRAGTFHRLATLTLRRHADRLGWTRGFGIADPDMQIELMEAAIRSVNAEGIELTAASRLVERIGFAFNTEQRLVDVLPQRLLRRADGVERIAATYTQLKLERDVMDFDDLLLGWRALLLDPEVGPELIAAADHVLVDEYQDTTRIQAAIAEQLASDAAICVVGDHAQAIYAFRGAARDNILRFDAEPTEVFDLAESFRFTTPIAEASVAALGGGRPLISRRGDGPSPTLMEPADDRDEARRIAARITELVAAGLRLADQAVLVRAQRQQRAITAALDDAGLLYTIRSARRVVDRPEVRGALAHLELIERPLDGRLWRRALETIRGIGPRTAEKIWNQLESRIKHGADPIHALEVCTQRRDATHQLAARLAEAVPAALAGELERALEAIGLETLDANAAEVVRDAARRHRSIAGLIDELQFAEDPRRALDAVTISTVHRAKGLEWPVVFVAGLSDGTFPIRGSDEEEERRLLHVAMTRAERILVLSAPSPRSRLLGWWERLGSR